MTPTEIRAALERLLLTDLLGPADEHEAIPTSVSASMSEHYLVGLLAPRDVSGPRPEENEPVAVDGGRDDDTTTDDTGTPAAPSLFPSSIGFTFAVPLDVSSVSVEAHWGRYAKEDSGDVDGEGRAILVWQRYPQGGDTVLDLEEGVLAVKHVDLEQPEVVIRGRTRSIGGVRLVTLFLVNEQSKHDRNGDEAWAFQPELSVRAADGVRSVFVGRPHLSIEGWDSLAEEESRTLDMLYRNTVEFAVGHGVGVHVDVLEGDPTRARRIRTVVVPSHEVPRTEAPPLFEFLQLQGLVLDMRTLAEADAGALASMLQPLVTGYGAWIDEQERRMSDPAARLDQYRPEAGAGIAAARRAVGRLAAGIALLSEDPGAAEAFRFANRAMWWQRVRSTVTERRRQTPALAVEEAVAAADVPEGRSWRVFQLAFVLLNLPSLTDPRHIERSEHDALVDLLFFPTGGGKTEAYLGLTAYTLAIRRLQGTVAGHDGGDGVAVLMRYTLRLLTSQQFQRASTLICACERIRCEALAAGDTRWGEVPFRIGMWVGGSVTPNLQKDAVISIRTLRKTAGRRSGSAASPLTLRSCPWCGTPIDAGRHVHPDTDRRRTFVYCGDDLGRCPFTEARSDGEGIPVVTVDEEIYRTLPSLLIATADKFAQLPWKGAVQNLFGRVDQRCERHGWRNGDEDRRLDEANSHLRLGTMPAAKTVPGGPLRPPDLIIQDELHLISGALGTLVGLYETAIDDLCSWEVDGIRVRPKVIASTATVRRAREQAHQLFWRHLDVFPPPVLDVEDSFFARQRDEGPGRRYLGVCARGVRLKAVEIRVYVALLAAAQKLFDEHGETVDPYMTLVGYFGAVRELAGMKRLVDDDVRTRLRSADIRGLARRRSPQVLELTSRAASDDLPDALERLALRHRPGREKNDPWPVDVLLATNMISVGVDVPRLGLMVVTGQPKATAEYIQATSRVGRDLAAPGLIITVYNWARPRDLSHYETFEHYHATFYRHVEGLSVTPFASRALARGLAAVVVSMVRQRLTRWNPNGAAQIADVGSGIVEDVKRRIGARAAGTTSDAAMGDMVEDMVQSLLDDWAVQQSVGGRHLAYRFERDGTSVPLLATSGSGQWERWTCPNSMRETEPNINLLIEPGGDGREERQWVFRGRADADAAQDAEGLESEPSGAPA